MAVAVAVAAAVPGSGLTRVPGVTAGIEVAAALLPRVACKGEGE